MKGVKVGLSLLFLLGIGPVIVGCESIGLIGRPTLGPQAGLENVELVAEVRGLDTRSKEIYLRTDDGRSKAVGYTDDTRVIMAGREYPVMTLREGDVVAVQLLKNRDGLDYVDLIRIRSRVDEPPRTLGSGVDERTIGGVGEPSRANAGRPGETETIEGRVEHVEYQRGFFEVRPRSGRPMRVYLPYNPPQPAEERFHRIRVGDYVRVEGELVSENRLELTAFLQDTTR